MKRRQPTQYHLRFLAGCHPASYQFEVDPVGALAPALPGARPKPSKCTLSKRKVTSLSRRLSGARRHIRHSQGAKRRAAQHRARVLSHQLAAARPARTKACKK